MRTFSNSNLEEDLFKIRNKVGAKRPPYLAEAILKCRYGLKLTLNEFVPHVVDKGLHTTLSAMKSYATRGSYPSDDDLKKFADIMNVSFEELKYGVPKNLIQVQSLTGLSPIALSNLIELHNASIDTFNEANAELNAQGDLRLCSRADIPRGHEIDVINWILENKSFLIFLANKVGTIKSWDAAKQKHGEYFASPGEDIIDGAKARIQREFLLLIEKRVEEELNNGRKKENKKR